MKAVETTDWRAILVGLATFSLFIGQVAAEEGVGDGESVVPPPYRSAEAVQDREFDRLMSFKYGVWWLQSADEVGAVEKKDDAPRELPDSGDVDVVILGDSLGDGVWAGLRHEFEGRPVFDLTKKSRPSTGLVRLDYYDWIEGVGELTDELSIEVAVVVFGANDRQIITKDGEHLPILSDAWKQEYADRIDRFTEVLKEEGAAVVWVGMPVMGPDAYSRDIKRMNKIYRERAEANGIEFVSTWDATADENGEFREDARVGGAKRRIRQDDGVHFTWWGYRIVADPVAGAVFETYGLSEDGKGARAEGQDGADGSSEEAEESAKSGEDSNESG